MAIVVFDTAGFKVRYPEFGAVTNPSLSAFFAEAELYLSNTDNSIVQNVVRREKLLWMLTAHVASLSGVLSPDGMPRAVGRVTNATEGSVNVGLEYSQPGTSSWYAQTQYGAAFWQATSAARSFRYVSSKGLTR